MRKNNSLGPRKIIRLGALPIVCGLIIVAPLLAGCSPQSLAQVATATASASTATPVTARPTVASTPPSVITAGTSMTATQAAALVTPALLITSTGTVTGTAVAEGTPTIRPTPSGVAQEPASVLNVFQFVQANDTLVKHDQIQLDGAGPEETLITTTGLGQEITGEVASALSVLTYDPVYREWNVTWHSTAVSGTASPIPGAGLGPGLGYNGGDLLRTGAPIFLLRTTTPDNLAHLHMYKWDRDKRSAQPVQMLATGSQVRDAVFDGDLDVNVADLDDDGVYEVVADNVNGTQVWKWDAQNSRYAPEGTR